MAIIREAVQGITKITKDGTVIEGTIQDITDDDKIIVSKQKIVCHCKCAITDGWYTHTFHAVRHHPRECIGM